MWKMRERNVNMLCRFSDQFLIFAVDTALVLELRGGGGGFSSRVGKAQWKSNSSTSSAPLTWKTTDR